MSVTQRRDGGRKRVKRAVRGKKKDRPHDERYEDEVYQLIRWILICTHMFLNNNNNNKHRNKNVENRVTLDTK